MDYVADKKLIKADTRVNLLGNKLVLIAPANSKLGNVKIEKGFDIAKLAGDGRIAVADVKAVPAGLYAKAALENLGAWAAAEPKLAQAENVRATLAFVARGARAQSPTSAKSWPLTSGHSSGRTVMAVGRLRQDWRSRRHW